MNTVEIRGAARPDPAPSVPLPAAMLYALVSSTFASFCTCLLLLRAGVL